MDPALRRSAAPKPSTWVGQHDPPYERRRAATEGPSRRRYLPSIAWRASTLARRVTISPAEKSVAFALARGSGTRRHCPDLRTTDSPTSPVRRTPDSRARPIANWDPVGCKRRREKRESVAAPQRRTQTRASAWKQQRCLLPRRERTVTPQRSEEAPAHRWLANAEADHGRAILRRRAAAHRLGAGAAAAKAVDARGPRRGRWRPAGQGRCSGGWRRTRPQTEPAESEERDPPTGPARHQLSGPGRRVLAPTPAPAPPPAPRPPAPRAGSRTPGPRRACRRAGARPSPPGRR